MTETKEPNGLYNIEGRVELRVVLFTTPLSTPHAVAARA
jgi:hypothetical protein